MSNSTNTSTYARERTVSDDVYFWSDTHFGHKGLINYGFRKGFTTIEEHDEALIERYNSRVSKSDRVYLLGDISFYSKTNTIALMKRLNGRKFIVWGNHDHSLKSAVKSEPSIIEQSYDYKEITVGEQRLVLFHFPILSWHQVGKGSWHLHGHSHNNLPPSEMAMLDVGVDAFPKGPASYDEITEILKDRVGMPSDHHGKMEL